MKRCSILLGNGLNRVVTEAAGVAWSDLLQDLCRALGVPTINLVEKPFPLAFEELCATCKPIGRSESDAKEQVAQWVRRVRHGALHDRLAQLPAANVLTTNYDYALWGGRSPEANAGTTELLYSLFRRRSLAERWIWHIHGEAQVPRSILLGHDQYVRYAKRIQDYLLVPRDSEKPRALEWQVTTARSPLTAGEEFSSDGMRHSWVDLFLRDDLHIVGAGLDFSEVILWWLLTIKGKESVRAAYRSEKRRWIPGRTYYYDVVVGDPKPSHVARNQLLKALGVEIVPSVARSYAAGFDSALSEMAHRMSINGSEPDQEAA